MRRFYLVSIIFILGFYGCDGKDDTGEEVSVKLQYEEKKEVKKPVLTEGEHDEFHPKSSIESVRKNKLTDFGMRTTPLPVFTPDTKSVDKAVENPEFFKMSVSIFINKNPVKPSYPFDFENDIAALKRLYNSHNLDSVLAKDMTELQKIKALMLYTYNFLVGGIEPTTETDIGPSAEIITKLRREKNIGGTSKHYAAMFCQLALSCGFNARIISMHNIDADGEIATHDVCEIFLNYKDKWAVFDVYSRATYYVKDNEPQSALELREVMFNKNYRVLNAYSGAGDFSDIISVREKVLPLYRYIYMWRMNDILSKSPKGGSIPWQALYTAHLVWEDERAPVSEGEFDKLDRFNSMENSDYSLKGVRYVAHDKNDFYWPLNHVSINVERSTQEDIIIHVDTITPNFENFEIFGSDISHGRKYRLYMENPTNFGIRSVNKFGLKGPISKLGFSFQ